MVDRLPLITLTIRDETDSSSVMRVNVVAGSSRAAAQGAAEDLRGALSGISDCSVTEQRIVYSRVDLFPAPVSGSTPEHVMGVFVFETDTPHEYAVLAVPGFRPNLCIIGAEGEGVLIDQAAADVAAFIGELVSGTWCNPWGHTLTRCAAAFVQIRP